MIGDMYDDGTPNTLIVKCPQCGGAQIVEYIGTGSVKYRCNACGEEFSYTGITGNESFRSCPNCGAMMSYDYIRGTWYCTSCGCMVRDNIGMSDKTEATKEQYIFAESPKYGWVCPKCGKVYAPDVKECWNCSQLASMRASNTQEKRVREDGSLVIDKSWFPNLTKDSTVYAGGGGTRWNKAEDAKAES